QSPAEQIFMGRFEIDRVAGSISVEEFARTYYLRQEPVIVQGVTNGWLANERRTPDYVRRALEHSTGMTEQPVWFDLAPENVLAGDYQTPTIVRELSKRPEVRHRKDNVRLWIASRGTKTAWHYDGNSIQGFNVAVKGRKRFILLSPQTPP